MFVLSIVALFLSFFPTYFGNLKNSVFDISMTSGPYLVYRFYTRAVANITTKFMIIKLMLKVANLKIDNHPTAHANRSDSHLI